MEGERRDSSGAWMSSEHVVAQQQYVPWMYYDGTVAPAYAGYPHGVGPAPGPAGPVVSDGLQQLLYECQKEHRELTAEVERAEADKKALETRLDVLQRAEQPSSSSTAKQSRYWTPTEHDRFLEAVDQFGPKNVKAISNHVKTRNPTQVRTHAQKFFLKVGKQGSAESGSLSDIRKPRPADTGLNTSAEHSAGNQADVVSKPSTATDAAPQSPVPTSRAISDENEEKQSEKAKMDNLLRRRCMSEGDLRRRAERQESNRMLPEIIQEEE